MCQTKERANRTYGRCLAGIFFAAVLLILCGILPQKAEAAEPADLLLSAEYEGGTVTLTVRLLTANEDTPTVLRAGRNYALQVQVLGEGTDFAGTIRILQQNTGENGICYSKEIAVSAGESGSCVFELPMNRMTEGMYLTVESEQGSTLIKSPVPFEVINYGTNLVIGVGVMEQGEGSSYDYFKSFGSELRELSYENFQFGMAALDSLDVIVASQDWIAAMPEDEKDCLDQWVEAGHLLVIGAVPDTKSIDAKIYFGLQDGVELQELIQAISTYETERNNRIYENEDLKKTYGEEVKTMYVGDSIIGPLLVNMLSQEPVTLPVSQPSEEPEAADVLWKEGARIILWQEEQKEGKILHFTIPLEAKANSIYPLAYYQLVRLVRENLPTGYEVRLQSESYADTALESSAYLLGYLTQNGARISVMPYLLLLFLYIAVLIPGAYLLLRRCGKSKYLWGVIPACSVVLVLVIFCMGRKTRITQPYCTYVNIIDYTKEGQNATLYFQLSAPTNRGTQVDLTQNAFLRYQTTEYLSFYPNWIEENAQEKENILRSKEYRVLVEERADGTKLSLEHVAAFSKTALEASYEVEQPGDLFSKITMTEAGPVGEIRNQTGLEFQDVYLYSDRTILGTGALQPEETVPVEECEKVFLTTSEYWYEDSTMSSVFGEQPYQGENSAVLNLIYDYVEQDGLEGDYLFAVLADGGEYNLLQEITENPHSTGLGIMIFSADVSEEESGFLGSIDSYQCLPDYVDYMEPDLEYRRIYTETYETEYDLSELDVTAVLYTEYRNVARESNSYLSYDELIYFYNYDTGSYDLLWRGGSEANYEDELTGEELSHYLGGTGILRMRIVNPSGTACLLPYLSVRFQTEEEAQR